MKLSKGKANPNLVGEMLEWKLKSQTAARSMFALKETAG
jgi:hypothetical protein